MSADPKILNSTAAKTLSHMNAILQSSKEPQTRWFPEIDLDKGDAKYAAEASAANSSSASNAKSASIPTGKKVETIADFPEEIQKFLLDRDNKNTVPWNVDVHHPTAHNIYRFELTDSVNARVHGFTPLMVLLLFGRSDLAEQMLNYQGIDLRLSAQNTGSFVFEDLTALSILLMRLNLSFSSGFLRTELRNARNDRQAEARDFALVKRLITLCPELMHHRFERDASNSGFTELSLIASPASHPKSLECLQLYHEHKANMDLQGTDGITPLYHAATQPNWNTPFRTEQQEVLLFLLNCGAEINHVPHPEAPLNQDPEYIDDGNTILHACGYYGLNVESVALLLSAGCKFNTNNKHNMTFHQIAMSPVAAYPEHIREELERLVNARYGIPDGISSEIVCVQNRRAMAEMYHIIETFYHALGMKNTTPDMSISVGDKKGTQEFISIEFVKQYIAMGLPLGLKDATGRSPLHVACSSQHPDSKKIVALLLPKSNAPIKSSCESSADEKVNAEQQQNNTDEPLLAMLSARDDDKHTPLDLAAKNNAPACSVLMHAIQPIIDRQVLQWRIYAAGWIDKMIKPGNQGGMPVDGINYIMQFFPILHSFAGTEAGTSYLEQGIQKALASAKIIEYATKKAKERGIQTRQSAQLMDWDLNATLTMYTQYTANSTANGQNLNANSRSTAVPAKPA